MNTAAQYGMMNLNQEEKGNTWYREAAFYHIFPLGLLGCETFNPQDGIIHHRLSALSSLIPYLHRLGITGVLLGPVFRSVKHGYDTLDYYCIDERLGDDDDLRRFIDDCHSAGIRVMLDGVFNHVGRGFWAFTDLCRNRENSPYKSWFCNVRFDRNNGHNDGFCYDSWEGHDELVKLNLEHPDVKNHLLGAVSGWIDCLHIDGIRLDAADCLSPNFIRDLRKHCLARRSDFYLMGEVIHGDYRQWANAEMLHGTTDYEVYKGLWSSHNDANYHEIAYSLRRQFGSGGIYNGLDHFQFVDNHDVIRAASVLRNPTHIFPLYAMLMTIPGIPAIYYGSEWGCRATKGTGFDADKPIRPCYDCSALTRGEIPATDTHSQDLWNAIQRLIRIRRSTLPLTRGNYEQLAVESQMMAFKRSYGNETIICAITSETNSRTISLQVPAGNYEDILNGGIFDAQNGCLQLPLCPLWARILRKV